MTELELAFHVEPTQRASLLKALGRRKLERVTLVARDFDTADLLLARHGLALRLHQEDGRWVQTLKASLPGAPATRCFEHGVDVGPEIAPQPDPARHRATRVGRRLVALLRRHGRPALIEGWRTDVVRLRRRLHVHGAEIEWSLDEGMATARDRTTPISELALEWKAGDIAGLMAAAREWQSRHGLWIEAASKAERGAWLLRGKAFAEPVRASPPQWSAHDAASMSGEAMLRRMVAASLRQVLANASEIARGSRDPEHVHQLRVGLRRLRVAAREMTPFAHALPADWESGVRPVFDALGDARDRHVFATELAPRLRRAGAPGPLPDEAAHDDGERVAQRVRGAVFQHALTGLLGFTLSTAEDEDRGDRDGARHVRHALRRLRRRIRRDASQFDDLPFDERHAVRKRLKRLRYLAEFVAPWFDDAAVEAWLKRVEPAQDAMGVSIDGHQAARRFEREAGAQPTAWFAVGWLRAREEAGARASRRALRRLARAAPFWRG